MRTKDSTLDKDNITQFYCECVFTFKCNYSAVNTLANNALKIYMIEPNSFTKTTSVTYIYNGAYIVYSID